VPQPPQPPSGTYGQAAAAYVHGSVPRPDSGPGVAWPPPAYVTGAGHTVHDTRHPSAPPAPASRKPLVLGIVALVIAVVAAGVVAAVVLKGNDDTADTASGPGGPTAGASQVADPQPGAGDPSGATGTPSGSAPPSLTPPSGASKPPITPPSGADQANAAPAAIPGYVWTRDPAGFSLFVPNGWKRSANGTQIDYVDPTGRTMLRIGTDTVGMAPLDNFTTIDADFAVKKQNYVRLQLAPHDTGIPGWEAAVWEFSWKGNPFNPQGGNLKPSHAIDLGIRTGSGADYAIYVASFEENWTASKRVFDTAVANFRQN
jgi:hypothetical protein